MLAAELAQGAGEGLAARGVVDAHELHGGQGGVGERTEEIEDGADAEGATHRHRVTNARVVLGRKEKADACLLEATARDLGWGVDAHPELLEDVGRAALARDAPVAVLGDGHAAGRGDEGGGGGQVEGVGPVAAGAAAVGDGKPAGVEVQRGRAHGFGRARHLVRGLALGLEPDEQGRELHLAHLAGHDGAEDGARTLAGEIFAAAEGLEGVGEIQAHGLAPSDVGAAGSWVVAQCSTASIKRPPVGVRIDSG